MLTKDIAYSLFNRLREFPDWCQCVVMSVLLRFVPSTDDEVFDVLVRKKKKKKEEEGATNRRREKEVRKMTADYFIHCIYTRIRLAR